MKKEQTAVEWLFEQLWNEPMASEWLFKNLWNKKDKSQNWYEKFEQAKQMDKQQKIEDYRSGRVDQQSGSSSNAYHRTAEQYYTETYGKS